MKHIDVEELLDVLDFEPLEQPIVRAVEVEPGCWRYDTPRTPFLMSRFEIGDDGRRMHTARGRELLLWVSGDRHGQCVYAADGETTALLGPATVYLVQET